MESFLWHCDRSYGYTGDQKTWMINKLGDLSFRFVCTGASDQSDPAKVDVVSLFEQNGKKVYVDDVLLSEGQYTYHEGSLIIKLNASYLNSLSIGKHVLSVEFDDGKASVEFYIDRPKENTPAKPDYVIPLTGIE